MTSLTAIFGSSQEHDSVKSEKLLELYWNRAELKKEFANLRDETFRLKEEIRSEKAQTARAEQKVRHLENLLLDRQWVHSVTVFYQLRALDNLCKEQIARFAEHLKQQREKRQHSRLVEEWGARRRTEVLRIEQKISELQSEMQLLEKRLQSERDRFSMMNGLVRFFRKRAIARALDRIADEIAAVQQKEKVLRAALAKANACAAPDTQGLSIADKRFVNCMILSFAQQLYLHFCDEHLAALAKDAGHKSVGTLNYGSKADCDFLLEEVCLLCDTMQTTGACAETLKLRAKLLLESAVYKSDDHAVPEADSVSTLYAIKQTGVAKKSGVNLLGENYWDLQMVFSR